MILTYYEIPVANYIVKLFLQLTEYMKFIICRILLDLRETILD